MKNIGLIGIGNCGSQIAYLGQQKYATLFDSYYINSSESDLAMIDGEFKFKIGDEEVEGSGKNRSKMKQYLKDNISDIMNNEGFMNSLAEKKYIFVIASAAGGTGSGAAPMLIDLLRNCFIDAHFILVLVLPQLKSSLMEQSNSLEFLKELYNVIDQDLTYMVYDNNSVTDKSPTEILEAVNENIIEDIRILSGIDNYPTPYESIDDADMESIITTPGRLIVTRIKSGLIEKNMEYNPSYIDDAIIKSIKQSAHAETDRNKRVLRLGLITYFNEATNKVFNPVLDKLYNFIGTPLEVFNHNAINDDKEELNFLYLIASGLSPINDRSKRIADRVDALKNALASDSTNKYILSAEDEKIIKRKEIKARVKDPGKIKTSEIFNKFM